MPGRALSPPYVLARGNRRARLSARISRRHPHLRRLEALPGEDLSGIHEALRIEYAADAIHHLEVVIREDIADVLALFQADAVFAGYRSASIGAKPQDLVADPEHGFVLTRFERIEEDERVKVAVAGVEHVADLEAGALADCIDLRERLGRSEEHTSELQSPYDLVCRLLLEKK